MQVQKIIHEIDRSDSSDKFVFTAVNGKGELNFRIGDYGDLINPEDFHLDEHVIGRSLFNAAGAAEIIREVEKNSAYLLHIRKNHIIKGLYYPRSLLVDVYFVEPNSLRFVFFNISKVSSIVLKIQIIPDNGFIQQIKEAAGDIEKREKLNQSILKPMNLPSESKTGVSIIDKYQYFKDGQTWNIVFKTPVNVINNKLIGLTYIHKLLSQPNIPISPEDLEGGFRPAEDELKEDEFKEDEFKEDEFKEDEFKEDEFKEEKNKDTQLSVNPISYYPAYDWKSKIKIKAENFRIDKEIRKLAKGLDDSDFDTNEKINKLRKEKEEIEEYLGKGKSLKNKIRNIDTNRKKPYDRVRKSINQARDSFKDSNAEFYIHLENSIKPSKNRPSHLIYSPDIDIPWVIQKE
jgi:hypothetical protein